MTEDRNFQVLEARPRRPRRDWPAETKARLIEATLKPGANVSALARQAGMAPSQLFGWRRQAIRSGAVTPQTDASRLAFVEITPAVSTATPAIVEIVLGAAVIRAGADVGEDHLARIIRAVRAA